MDSVLIGKALSGQYAGQDVRFSADDRKQSTYILGAPGSGKTELLKILIQHELQAGHAVVVLDAHSDLCTQVANWPEFAQQHRRKVMLVTPNLFEGMTPTINLLQVPKGATSRTKEILANRLAQVIGEMCLGEGASTVTTRMLNVAKCTARVLLDFENTSLQDLADFLGEDPPAHFLRAGRVIDDAGVRDFFLSDWDSGEYTASKGAMRARLKNLLLMSDFRAMACGPNTVPLYDWLDDGGTVLFSLGEAGTETAQILGRMVTCMIAAYGDMRKGTGRTDRKPVHFFIDECHNFVGPATQTILTELRKYGIHLTMAHQFADQIPDADLKALLNATRVKFLGATAYSPIVTGLMGCDRQIATNLPNRQFLVKWGSAELMLVQVRSDLADDRHQMRKSSKIALHVAQRRFYRPLDTDRPLHAETAPSALPQGLSREFD